MRTLKTFLFILLAQFIARNASAQQAVIDSMMVLHTMKGDVYGTLQVPAAKKKIPVVLIIAGSGPVDRNGNHDKMENNCLRMVADSLQRHGIASLRYDKRGIGASKAAAPSEDKLLFSDYITDAEGWINMLKADSRFSKVVVLGHGEGAVIGAVAAREAGAKALISVNGIGKPADQLLREELAKKMPPATMDTCNRMFDELVKGNEIHNVDRKFYMIFRPTIQPYLISWFKYNPQTELSKLKMPVLLVQGTTDIEAKADDVKLLAAANKSAKVKMIEGMNHIMKKCSADFTDNLSADMNPKLPLMPEFVKVMVSFAK
jgi:uncharacterized protein